MLSRPKELVFILFIYLLHKSTKRKEIGFSQGDKTATALEGSLDSSKEK